MRIVFLVGLIVFAQPAQACHRFSIWKYPSPQRCGVITRVVAKPAAAVVSLAPPPVFDEESARQRGLAQLRLELGALTVGR